MSVANPKLLKQTVFSSKRLLLFALLFGLVGGYILLRTFASPNPNLPGDLNGDNTVAITDLSILLSNYNTTNPTADINLDGTVNILDLSILLTHYGQSYSGSTPGGPWSGPWRNTSYIVPTAFTKIITTASGFKNLASTSGSLVVGDVVHVVGPMTIDGCAGCHTDILRKLAAPGASIYFDSNVIFAGDTNTTNAFAAVNVDATNIAMYGGTVAGGQWDGIHIGPGFRADTVNTANIKWWGVKIHDVGGQGILANGIVNSSGQWISSSYLDIDAEAWNVGLNYNADPHTVKGTGLHAMYVGAVDSDPSPGAAVSNSKFSIYTHDTSHCAGDVQAGPSIVNSEFWIHAERLSFMAGYGWTAARALTPFTAASSPYSDKNLTVHDVEAYDLTGPVVYALNLGSGPVTVEYGRGTRVLTNSTAYSYFSGNAWTPNSNITYQNVLP